MEIYNRILRKIKQKYDTLKKNRLEIILYHSVSREENIFTSSGHNIKPDDFRKQIQYLKENFKVIPLRQIREIFSGDKIFDGPYACVCFDDGYLNNLTEAYPILEELKIPATIFICPSVLGNKGLLWRDKINFLISRGLADDFVGYLKKSKNSHKYRFAMLKEMTFYKWSKNKSAITDMSIREDLDQYFTEKNISESRIAKQCNLFMERRDLTGYEYLDFGNHTWSHPLMTLLDYEQQKKEILKAHEYLSEAGIVPFALAMPFSPFNDDTIKICRDIGYTFLLTVASKSNILTSENKDFFVLHRWMAAPGLLKKLKAVI
ncbi:MAG: polysaccharide deacetylase family protein [Patescibacteria group bacterium]|nr:polysaccharide deacetylase family protein [Patescibacteria group bacterium]